MNRLSATRIYECSVLFSIEPNFFFDGLTPEMALSRPTGFVVKQLHDAGPLDINRNLKLVAAYEAVDDDVSARRLFALVKALGRVKGDDEDWLVSFCQLFVFGCARVHAEHVWLVITRLNAPPCPNSVQNALFLALDVQQD